MIDEFDKRIPDGLSPSQVDRFVKSYNAFVADSGKEVDALRYALDSLTTPEDRSQRIGELNYEQS